MTLLSKNKHGVALVAVLGFLSILTMLAVAFLIAMRTERLAADFAIEDTRARLLMDSALVGAMDEIDYSLNSLNPAGNPVPARPANIHVPKNWAVFESSPGSGTPVGNDVDLFSNEVLDWIPAKYLLQSGDPGYDADFDVDNIWVNSAHWIPVLDPQTNRILGRYAYVAVDCSGLLDINLIAQKVGVTHRSAGENIGEIDLYIQPDLLPDAAGSSADADLRENRSKYHRFSTFPEMIWLNDGLSDINGFNEKHAINADKLSSLTPVSLSYENGWWDWNAREWKYGDYGVAGNIQAWDSAAAQSVFSALYGAAGNDMALCFQDYVDADDFPANVNIPTCEAIPMINEVAVTHDLKLVGQQLTYSQLFEVELWYPFPGNPNSGNYTVTFHPYTCRIIARAGANNIVIPPNAANQDQVCVPGPVIPDPGVPFVVVTARYDFVYTFPAAVTTNDFPIDVRSAIRGIQPITEAESGTEVDWAQIPDRSIGPMRIGIARQGDPASPVGQRLEVSACNDPRLNHLSTDWDTPLRTTMGTTNQMTGFNLAPSGDREGTAMYVRNSTNLDVAELGYIPTGKNPWETIDLFSAEGRELLTKFSSSDIGSRVYTNSFVNPNSQFSNVLMAVFQDTPINDYPDGPTNVLVDLDVASALVDGMLKVSGDTSVYAENSFDSRAGWVNNSVLAAGGDLSVKYAAAPYYMDNTRKEAIIRNSYRMFNANENLLMFFIVAQAVKDNGSKGSWDAADVITAEKRAVAVVWRDPFPNDDGRHTQIVRLFKVLDE